MDFNGDFMSCKQTYPHISLDLCFIVQYVVHVPNIVIGGQEMRAISYTKARNSLASTMKQVCEDHNPIIVTRKNNQAVIMMSLEDYESLTETAYLMQSPKNAKRLIDSIKELKDGHGQEKDLIE
jgi:antitoxin YefM